MAVQRADERIYLFADRSANSEEAERKLVEWGVDFTIVPAAGHSVPSFKIAGHFYDGSLGLDVISRRFT